MNHGITEMKKEALVTILGFLTICLPVSVCSAAKMELTALSSMDRVGQDQHAEGAAAVEIKAARNEVESFQVVVAAPDENIGVVKVEVSDLVGPGDAKITEANIKLFREEYVRVRISTSRAELPPGLYPDPLVPFIDPETGKPIEPLTRTSGRWGEPATTSGHDMYAVPFDVFNGQNQTIWVDVHVPKDAVAGTYRGKLSVSARDGISGQIPVTLTVWGFTLPDGPTHRNHFGNFSNIARYFNIERGSDRFRTIEMEYCRAMAEHRINPPIPSYLLPEVNDDGSLNVVAERHKALKEFMSRFHVTDFEIPRARFARLPGSTAGPDYKTISPENREKAKRYYREFYKYLKDNDWEKRAYLYMLDEPNLRENYEQVLVLGRLVHEAVPELKCLVVEQPYPQDTSWPDIDPAVDIWCPLWSFIDGESINDKKAHGDEVWSYTALVQRAPRYHPQYEQVKNLDPPYWHIDRPLAVYRVPTWINYQYEITGLLYWSTVTTVIEPWFNPAFAHPRHYNGGGFLFYPGVRCGIDGPVTSMRLKNLRDGMEDYEYFALLERLAGRKVTQEIVGSVAPNWWDFSKEGRQFLAARERLAEQIVKRQEAGAEPRALSPALPNGRTVATFSSDELLQPPDSMRGVSVASTPPVVDFLYYPGQSYEGKPWSNWGDGVATPGKYYSAIGDHKAPDGNAFVYEYDTATRTLTKVVDLQKLLDVPDGRYSPGKIHSRIDMGSDGWLYFSTHRGSTRVTTDKYGYKGDWIIRYNPRTSASEVVAHGPVGKHCIPCSVLDPDRLIFYGGTAAGDPADKRILFFAYDIVNRKLLYSGEGGPARYMLFSRSAHRVYFTPDLAGPVFRYDPAKNACPVKLDVDLAVRAATKETPQGYIYTVSKDDDATIYRFDTKTEKVERVGSARVGTQTYITTIDAAPTGRYLYYVPGAHGGSERDGCAIVQFDVVTGRKKVIAFLHPFLKQKIGYTPLGTFSTAVSPSGETLYITWNGNLGGTSRGRLTWDACALTVIHIPDSERRP